MSQWRATVIAVASGKGGTGKTTIAAHLALAGASSRSTLLVDLDVEAPDVLGYFPDARSVETPEPVTVRVPRHIPGRCTGCGVCAACCRFGAIVAIRTTVVVDGHVCAGCGRCVARCPGQALAESESGVGLVSCFRSGDLDIIEGRMGVGDIRSTTVIEAAKRKADSTGAVMQIRDCPPGVSCPATHSVEGADYVVLVAEPTEFSLHDLDAAIRLTLARGIPAGVVLNKDGFGTADVTGFCERRHIQVIGRIGFDRTRAASGAAGRLWESDRPFMREMERVLAVASSLAPSRSRPGAGGAA